MDRPSMGTALLALAATVSLGGCSMLGQLASYQQLTPIDGRIELPEAGIALAFPNGWQLEPRPTSSGVGLASTLDPEWQAQLVPLVAALPGHRHDRCAVVDATAVVQAWSERPTLDEVVGLFEASLGTDRRWGELESDFVELPAGRVGRILRDRVGESESASIWVFSRADAWFYLECVTHSRLSEDWRSIAQTFEFLPAAEAPTPDTAPAAEEDPEVFVDAMCSAFDELLLAVGNPDTGEGSDLSLALDDAIARGDEALVATTSEAMLGHLDTARSVAARAATFPSAAAGIRAFDDFLVIVADSVVAKRDAAPAGLEAANDAANREWARAYESWRGWLTELGPVWDETAGDLPMPCPSARG